MILFSYILSTLSGYFFLNLLFRNFRCSNLFLHIALSVGIGLGLSALLNFLTLLILGEYNRLLIAAMSFLLPMTLFLVHLISSKQHPEKYTPLQKKLNPLSISFCVFAVAAFFFITFAANIHPFGEWDAWALWNMKLKFLVYGGREWKNIFTQLHWSTQPDYPLLLPLMNMTPFAFFPHQLLQIPMMTAILLTFSIGLVLFAGLKKITPLLIALLAYILLMSNAFFQFQSTSQYSDVLLGLYLLMSFVCIALWEKEKNSDYLGILGIILGLMTFTKNEGIVIAGLVSGLVILNSLLNASISREQKIKSLKTFLLCLAVIFSVTIYFKLFLAPKNRDILVSVPVDQLKFFNLNGLMLVLRYYMKEILHVHWSFLWIFCGILISLGIRRAFLQECRTFSIFFILYFIILTLIYLTTANFDLEWRLNNTVSRIFSYLLPSVLYYSFYINYFSKNNSNTSHENKT